MSELRKILLGVVYVVVVVAIASSFVVDFETMKFHRIGQHEVGVMFGFMGLAMLGFMLITGKGMKGTPRPSRYS